MKSNSQLSLTLHLLLHMADTKEPVTSQALAAAMNTNAVVVRRTMAGLREHGLVHSRKGHHGGWLLKGNLPSMTLRDVYLALGSPPLLALNHRTENPLCVVEQAVNTALDSAFRDAEALLLTRFGEVTLATLQSAMHTAMRAATQSAVHHHPSHCLEESMAS